MKTGTWFARQRLLKRALEPATKPRKTKCHLCEQITDNFPTWDLHRWACRPCWRDYVRFRRYYKDEHGKFPKVDDFRAEDPE